MAKALNLKPIERNEKMEHATENTEPRIYVACLAAYNSGILHGAWIDANREAWAIYDDIAAMLKASPIPDAEEWAICVSACNRCPPDSVIGVQRGTAPGSSIVAGFTAGDGAEDDDGGDGWTDQAGAFGAETVGARDRAAAACF